MVNFFQPDPNLLRRVPLTDDQRDAMTVNLLSGQDDSVQPVVVVPQDTSLGQPDDRLSYVAVPAVPQTYDNTLPQGTLPAPPANLPPPAALTGQEPLPQTDDPWYGRIMGTVNNILNLGKEKQERSPSAIQDWVNQFATSPFLAMPRNEVFDRMREQANANLDREAKMGRTGSEAAPLQIYKHFLGENGYGAPDNTPEQNQMLAQDAYAKTMAFLQSSRSNINIGGDTGKLFDKIAEQTYKDLYEGSSDYPVLGPRLDNTISNLRAGTFGTGGGSVGEFARELAANWGLMGEDEAKGIADFQELNMSLRSSLMKSFKGAISDREQRLISAALPGLGKSKDENIATLELLKLEKQLAWESYQEFSRLASTSASTQELNSKYAEYLNNRYADTVKRVAAITGGSSASAGGPSPGGRKLKIVR